MDERIVAIVQGFIPGAEVLKVYKDASGNVKLDVKSADMGEITCSLKKNHAGEFYIE